jgi:hypothetical protein
MQSNPDTFISSLSGILDDKDMSEDLSICFIEPILVVETILGRIDRYRRRNM